jgi:hypothetical protein
MEFRVVFSLLNPHILRRLTSLFANGLSFLGGFDSEGY